MRKQKPNEGGHILKRFLLSASVIALILLVSPALAQFAPGGGVGGVPDEQKFAPQRKFGGEQGKEASQGIGKMKQGIGALQIQPKERSQSGETGGIFGRGEKTRLEDTAEERRQFEKEKRSKFDRREKEPELFPSARGIGGLRKRAPSEEVKEKFREKQPQFFELPEESRSTRLAPQQKIRQRDIVAPQLDFYLDLEEDIDLDLTPQFEEVLAAAKKMAGLRLSTRKLKNNAIVLAQHVEQLCNAAAIDCEEPLDEFAEILESRRVKARDLKKALLELVTDVMEIYQEDVGEDELELGEEEEREPLLPSMPTSLETVSPSVILTVSTQKWGVGIPGVTVGMYSTAAPTYKPLENKLTDKDGKVKFTLPKNRWVYFIGQKGNTRYSEHGESSAKIVSYLYDQQNSRACVDDTNGIVDGTVRNMACYSPTTVFEANLLPVALFKPAEALPSPVSTVQPQKESIVTSEGIAKFPVSVNCYPNCPGYYDEMLSNMYVNVYRVKPVGSGRYAGTRVETKQTGSDASPAVFEIKPGELVLFLAFDSIKKALADTSRIFAVPPLKHFGSLASSPESPICQIRFLDTEKPLITQATGLPSCFLSVSIPLGQDEKPFVDFTGWLPVRPKMTPYKE